MATTISPMDELEAVNLILRNDGESPVSSLSNTGFGEAADALAVLRQTSRSIQTSGWTFNTDYEMKFTPDTDGNIFLPKSTLWFTPAGLSKGHLYVQRAGKLYDPEENTFVFASPVYLDICTMQDFADMTEPARAYIAIVAARKFQGESTGSPAQDNITADDEMMAKVNLEKAESRVHRRGGLRVPNALSGLKRGLL